MSFRTFMGSAAIMAIMLIFTTGAGLSAREMQKRVTFQAGKSSQVVEGSVVRGDRDIYLVNAKAKQTMVVFIGSLEDNAVFTIIDTKTGKALKGTEEGADAMRWHGELPSSGDYRIIVGGTRGNASYIMKIEISSSPL